MNAIVNTPPYSSFNEALLTFVETVENGDTLEKFMLAFSDLKIKFNILSDTVILGNRPYVNYQRFEKHKYCDLYDVMNVITSGGSSSLLLIKPVEINFYTDIPNIYYIKFDLILFLKLMKSENYKRILKTLTIKSYTKKQIHNKYSFRFAIKCFNDII